MEADGADLIDIGGESTRPGAEPVDADEELPASLPVVEALRGRLRVPISIDTYKAAVADAALARRRGDRQRRQRPAVRSRAWPRSSPRTAPALVLMHTRGRSKNMYARGGLQDRGRGSDARTAGSSRPGDRRGRAARTQILVDPGIGFAKRPEHSYGVLARLPEIAAALDRPVLVGPSRKSFLREAAGGRRRAERDWATAAAVTAAVLGGAHIVRVHAVAEMVQVVRVAEADTAGDDATNC